MYNQIIYFRMVQIDIRISIRKYNTEINHMKTLPSNDNIETIGP